MAKYVIDIPKELYEAYKGRPPMLGDAGMDMIAQAIANGTPLPKGHGRMIDAGNFINVLNNDQIEGLNTYKGLGRAKELLIEAPTIIEADKKSEEE